MTANNTSTEPLPVGTIVKIANTGYRKGKIVEYRGPLGAGGARIYRVRVRSKPKPAYTEVREDQLVVLPSHSP
jgi:hypothetical protein